ncbi:MAG: ISL3 family transposase [Gammaproteobacteria bacterium]|jgi:transposase|nr:ISL3 family transposase [Candidatus Neomarinimicrobiota bacterium]MBT4331561.1 ISL3 family transposase [Gammaproteobacteria bacterium]MBT4605727.1 ISL3 family transposase [Thiotrichales bacterium]
MQIKTILNRVQKFKSFVYGKVRLLGCRENTRIEVDVVPRSNSRPRCSKCGRSGPCYDHLPMRRFEFVPLWGVKVFLLYAPRRVDCPKCGVKVEEIPWALGKRPLTKAYGWFLSGWAKRLSWKETAGVFRTSWESVFRSVEMAVEWGRKNQNLDDVHSIGIDEIAWKKGHKYLTLVYQIDEHCKRLLWIGNERKTKTLLSFFHWLGGERSGELQYICSDMWKPYLKVIAKKAGQAIHILDRFHIMAHFSKALDEVRAGEVKELKANGYEPILTKTRWLLLKRPENLTEGQEVTLAELLQYNLRSVRAYLLKEDFQQFWSYVSPYWAERFLEQWCKRTMLSKIKPMKRVAQMLRNHKPLLLNWFRAKGQLSSGVVEGFNTKAKLTTRKAFGFRTFHGAEIALYHTLGNLPEPDFTHKFC